ncbi:hypothetical protein KIN20_025618, partial [Parelaphostrongylus tenuis]
MTTVKIVGQLLDSQWRMLFNRFDDGHSINFVWTSVAQPLLQTGVHGVKLSRNEALFAWRQILSICTVAVLEGALCIAFKFLLIKQQIETKALLRAMMR